MSGAAVLESMIARLRALGSDEAVHRVAEKAAPRVLAALQKTAGAGTTPDGEAWQAKKSGGRPLAHAADALDVEAHGRFVVATLTGPTVFHHRGAQGKPVRQVLPDSGTIPDGVRAALVDAAKEVFEKIVKGGG